MFVPAFASEIPVDREAIEPHILDEVLHDPEAETYQFVWRAVPDNGVAVTRELAARCQELDDEFQAVRIRVGVAEATASATVERNAELEWYCETLEAEVRALRDEVAAINNTKIMRSTRRLREVYRARVLRD